MERVVGNGSMVDFVHSAIYFWYSTVDKFPSYHARAVIAMPKNFYDASVSRG